MPGRDGVRLTYANITATLALLLALAALAMPVRNLISSPLKTQSGGATWFIGGGELIFCGRTCELSLAPSGHSFSGSSINGSNQQLSPNAVIVASDFSVRVERVPPGATRKFFLTVPGADAAHSLLCEISASNTTCNSGAQTLTIMPGSSLFIDAAIINNSEQASTIPTRVEFSWLATTQ
jgi:hypothetical protein